MSELTTEGNSVTSSTNVMVPSTHQGDVILSVNDLSVSFKTQDGLVQAVSHLSYEVRRGQTLAIVGESGSGKSVSSLAVMGLLGSDNANVTGEVNFDGKELISSSADTVRQLRGLKMAMIFQDPLSALHPYYSIGKQLVEAVTAHQDVSKEAARARALEMLNRVGIPSAEKRIDDYPHQLSGGMRQRVMIAMALINDPELLIADEPTTALDVTVQAQIIELLRDLQKEFGTAIVIITHDLGVVADVADDVIVMYGGAAAEQGPVREIFYQPEMPYTWGLLASIPKAGDEGQLDPIPGTPPSLIHLPKGCVFAPRCAFRSQVPDNACATTRPDFEITGPNHAARCHLTTEQRKTIRLDRKIGK
ncbi:MAG: ABC transporter ATP-binding protein [Actinobacteria bacterium]|nr:ABC transporter ATP-binding protein [Actinomycetota bacterium]